MMPKEERETYSRNALALIADGYDYADIARQYTEYLQKSIDEQTSR